MRYFANYNFILLIAASMTITNRPAIASCPLANRAQSSTASGFENNSGNPSLGNLWTYQSTSSSNIGNKASNIGNSPEEVGKVEKLTDSNMNTLMKSETWIVRYFRSDCPQNDDYEAAWKKLLQEYYSKMVPIRFATADCNVELRTCSVLDYGVPAYIAYKDKKLLKRHEVNRYDYEDLKPFFDDIFGKGNGQSNGMNKSQYSHGFNSISSSFQFPSTSHVKKTTSVTNNGNSISKGGFLALTSQNQYMVSRGKWILYFSKPNCSHCQNFPDEWNQRVQNKQNEGAQYATVNCLTSPDLCPPNLEVPALFEFNKGKATSIKLKKLIKENSNI